MIIKTELLNSIEILMAYDNKNRLLNSVEILMAYDNKNRFAEQHWDFDTILNRQCVLPQKEKKKEKKLILQTYSQQKKKL